MSLFEIVAHRGICDQSPKNTIPAFLRALELGADAIEMDVRLTSDHVPVIFHYYYLHELAPDARPIFELSSSEISRVKVKSRTDPGKTELIPTFRQVMELLAGRINLEIEIKGPEPESIDVIASVLDDYRQYWDDIEVTSFEPALLLGIRKRCPGLITDLLLPRSESWMGMDVVAFQAIHRARLAQARAVHLHPSQLSRDVVDLIRNHGLEIHAWDVNDMAAIEVCKQSGITRICTDKFHLALGFRNRMVS